MKSETQNFRQILKDSKEINFYPWIGVSYKEGLCGKKVLVLGESHYCRKELSEDGICFPCCNRDKMTTEKGCFSQTEDFVDGFVNGCDLSDRTHRTFYYFESAVCGKKLSQEERELFWNRIAFYNYVQYAQVEPRRSLEEAEDSSLAFKKVLETLMPDCIVIWGKTKLWKLLPEWDGSEDEISIENGGTAPVWNYRINEKNIPAMAVNHPSSPGGNSWDYWHAFYKIFIGECDMFTCLE